MSQDSLQSPVAHHEKASTSSPSHSTFSQSNTAHAKVSKAYQAGPRKRWKSNEVHLLLLACVHFRKLYHSNAAQALDSMESALSFTVKTPASKLRVKIKNIRSVFELFIHVFSGYFRNKSARSHEFG